MVSSADSAAVAVARAIANKVARVRARTRGNVTIVPAPAVIEYVDAACVITPQRVAQQADVITVQLVRETPMPKRPNIVLILTDNQAPWSIGCYGNPDIRTPHIDGLANAGVRFDNAFCVNPVCSPNRATALTGLIPSQHGVHSWLGTEKPSAQMGDDAYQTLTEFPTLPDLLATEGYRCGLTGKWHLGDSLSPPAPFSYWFTMPRGHTGSFYDTPAIWQGKQYTEPRYFTDVIAEHAETYIRDAAADDQPFFLYAPFNGPYGLDHDLHDGHRNRHAAHYADMDLPDFPRNPRHPWQKAYLDNNNNPNVFRNYAAAVSGVDDGVGRILNALDETGVADNTIVIYTSDHGICGGHHGFWGMSDHSFPNHLVQTNLTIPLIVRHPQQIAAGRTASQRTSHYDLFPTLLDYLDIAPSDLGEHPRVGSSYADLLRRKDSFSETDETNSVDPPRLIFHEHEYIRCVQDGQWKLTLRHPAGPHELFHLEADPGEWCNLYDDPDHRTQRDRLTHELEAFFADHVDPQFDLWRDGRSKAGITSKQKV